MVPLPLFPSVRLQPAACLSVRPSVGPSVHSCVGSRILPRPACARAQPDPCGISTSSVHVHERATPIALVAVAVFVGFVQNQPPNLRMKEGYPLEVSALDTSTLTADADPKRTLAALDESWQSSLQLHPTPDQSILNMTQDDSDDDSDNTYHHPYGDGDDEEDDADLRRLDHSLLATTEGLAHEPAREDDTPTGTTTPSRPCYTYMCADLALSPSHDCRTPEQSVYQPSLWDGITERLVDGMCISLPTTKDSLTTTLQHDIVALLGCLTPPTARELIDVWGSIFDDPLHQERLSPVAPRKRNVAQRQGRIRRLLQQQLQQQQQSACPLRRTQSLASHHRPQFHSNHPKHAEDQQDDEGYDSDPQVVVPPTVSRHESTRSTRNHQHVAYNHSSLDHPRSVEDTWQRHWHLLWHSPEHSQAVVVRVWFERGQFLESCRQIVDPKLVWQPLEAKDTPRHALSLLQVTRIVPTASRGGILIQEHSTARHVLECPHPALRDELIYRWKHLVSRCMALVVVHDMTAFHREFFVPDTGLRGGLADTT